MKIAETPKVRLNKMSKCYPYYKTRLNASSKVPSVILSYLKFMPLIVVKVNKSETPPGKVEN